jgi:hypothetical protein
VQPPGVPIPMLTPALPPQMLAEALQHLRTLPQVPLLRADVFEALAAQVTANDPGWQAVRGVGTDGSHVFLGTQGAALVIAPDGRLFRGRLGQGVNVVVGGLAPDYAVLTDAN